MGRFGNVEAPLGVTRMGSMTRTRKAYRLSQRVKYEDTKPERVLQILVEEMNDRYWLNRGKTIEIQDMDGKYWSINPDFEFFKWCGWGLTAYWKKTGILVEVDGIYHDTPIQRKKTEWRDGLLTKAGYRVIHVDAELTKNKVYQTYLKDKLAEAINSKEAIVRIDA